MSGLCPRCGAATLFEAPARIAMSCEQCALSLAELERGARLAGLVTILVAAILISMAMAVDIYLSPPFWLQVVVWAPLTMAVVIGILRLYKTALLYRQYEVQAEQEQGEQ
ncbi:MAG: DUF983 domain-containing protein [Erythrobacter sp.]|nr:DUF983 domain-containing protein [Erythrobacter sp.]